MMVQRRVLAEAATATTSLQQTARLFAATAVVGTLAAFSTPAAASVWDGAGVGANSGTEWNLAANYTGDALSFSSASDLDFSTITVAGPTALTNSATGNNSYDMKDLLFGFGTSLDPGTAEVLTLSGNGTAGATTLNLSGNISVPSTSGSKVTLGSDLTLNLTNASHTVIFKAHSKVTANPSPLPVLIVNSLVTGGGTGARFVNAYSAYGTGSNTPSLLLTNNSNSFVAVENRFDGQVGYTSIANVGGGNSSLGNATTVATGKITLGNGSFFNYIGSGDQTSDRDFGVASGNTFGNASAGTTVTLNGQFITPTDANYGVTLKANVVTSSTLVINAAIADSVKVGALSPKAYINKQGSTPYTTATGTIGTNDGGGTLVLGGLSTYTGTVTVSAGTLEITNVAPVASPNALGMSDASAANVLLSNGTTLRYKGATASTDRLFTINGTAVTLESSGAGAVTFTNTGSLAWGANNQARTLKLGGSNTAANSLAAAMANNGSGVVSVTKQDAGTWVLAGISTYTGATTISGGKLLVNGQLGNSAVSIAPGATLGGTGSLAGSVSAAGSSGNLATISPGASIGTLTTSGNVTFGDYSNLLIEFDGDSIDLLAGAAINLASASDSLTIQATGVHTPGRYVFATYTGSLGNNVFNNVTITGLDDASIDYATVGQIAVVIPEPATLGAALGAGAVTLLNRRRRVRH